MGAKLFNKFSVLLLCLTASLSYSASSCRNTLLDAYEKVSARASGAQKLSEWEHIETSSDSTKHYSKKYVFSALPDKSQLSVYIKHDSNGLLTLSLGTTGYNDLTSRLTEAQKLELQGITRDILGSLLSYINKNTDVLNVRIELSKGSRKFWEKNAFSGVKFKRNAYRESPELDTGAIVFSTIVLTPLTFITTAIVTFFKYDLKHAFLYTGLSVSFSIFGGTAFFMVYSRVVDYVEQLFIHGSYADFEVTQEMRNKIREVL